MSRRPFERFHGTHRKAREQRRREAEARRKREEMLRQAREEEAARPANAESHGLHTLKATLDRLGGRALDPDSEVGRAAAAWRAELVQDLGGEEAVTAQQATVIDLAVRTKILLDSVDGYLVQLESLVNKRKRAVWPVVQQRQQLADALAKYMQQLGLERRSKPVPSLHEYIAKKSGEGGA